ncbi:MAG: fatty acid desaturase, partial [Aureispira sp.]
AQWGHYMPIAILLIWFIGCVQFAMGESLLHEASHGNLFRTAWLNKAVGHLIAAAILTNFQEWKTEHSIHHGQLLSERDHLTQDYQSYQLQDGIAPYRLWMMRPLLGVVGWQWLQSEGLGLFRHWRSWMLYSLVGLVAFYNNSLLFLGMYWVLPLVWAYPAVLYWSEITDHHLAKSNTRTNTSWFWNFMFHNGGYHWVHHEYPFIPWYLLPQANAALADSSVDKIDGWWAMYQLLLEDYRG